MFRFDMYGANIGKDSTFISILINESAAHSLLYLSLLPFVLESSIEEPPRIIEKPPSNIPTREGDPITLRVRAIGHPEPQIAFVKDGRKDPYASPAGMFDNPMMPQERPVIDKVAPGIFEISFPGGVNKDDNGWYTCSATSPAGVDSFSCKINIKSKFREFPNI